MYAIRSYYAFVSQLNLVVAKELDSVIIDQREHRVQLRRGRIMSVRRVDGPEIDQRADGDVEQAAGFLAEIERVLQHAIGEVRITSYNVCYTKLLRS